MLQVRQVRRQWERELEEEEGDSSYDEEADEDSAEDNGEAMDVEEGERLADVAPSDMIPHKIYRGRDGRIIR